MTIYHLSTRICSNVPIEYLRYDLCIYRMDSNRNKFPLVDVKQQQFQKNYATQSHMTENISEPLSTIYIMEMKLYRKTMLHTHCMTAVPFTKMYTLEEFSSGNAWSSVKRENPCYFESKGTMKPASQGGETKQIQITVPERPFIAKEHPVGDSRDPFERNIIEQQINKRFHHFPDALPDQNAASTCGPAVFFYCILMDRPDVYAQAARDLWRYGKTKIGELIISPGEGCLHPGGNFYTNDGRAKMLGLDWMTLAGLRDSENKILSFDTLDSPMAGITMWQTLTEWFEKAGYEKIFSNVGPFQAGIQGIQELNDYAQKGYKIVTLINDGLLGRSNSNLTVPTHWIVWEGPASQDPSGYMHLNLFSWGNVYDQIKQKKDVSFFISRFFGGVVFKPLK